MYNKEEAQERINQLQAEGKPFVFIINFECTQAFVEATTDLDSNEMMCAFPRFSNVPHHARAGVEPLRWCAKPPRRADYEQSINLVTVSYTHLDVYKRQHIRIMTIACLIVLSSASSYDNSNGQAPY